MTHCILVAIRHNQTQSDAIRRNQTQSDAIRRNQTQSGAFTVFSSPAYSAPPSGVTAPSAEPLEALKSALSLSDSNPRAPAAGDEGAPFDEGPVGKWVGRRDEHLHARGRTIRRGRNRARFTRGSLPEGRSSSWCPRSQGYAVPAPTPLPALPALTALLAALARRAADCTRVSMRVASSVDAVGSDETALPSS